MVTADHEGALGVTEHLDRARPGGLHPEGGVTLAHVPEQRT
jgi:hypothetical protein